MANDKRISTARPVAYKLLSWTDIACLTRMALLLTKNKSAPKLSPLQLRNPIYTGAIFI
jgi:hypothetical protein